MDTRAAFTTDEKWLLIRIMRHLNPKADPEEEPEASLDDNKEGWSTDGAFTKAYEVLTQEYERLATMETRNRWVHGARQALSLVTVRRNNWTDASQFLVLYTKLLDSFGWGSAELTAAVQGATQAVGTEEAKNAVLFQLLVSLPFGIVREPTSDVGRIIKVLDQALYGMQGVKRQIRNQMVLLAHADGTPRSAPLLLVGPPGTGKTAVAQAIASALDLPFFSLGLGGNCDTILLRGSSYTWSSSTPGFFPRTLVSAGCLNPVILLDEIDKSGGHANGDLIDTLTEVFDVNQADRFRDLFLLDIPVDLSKVYWIATANDLNRVPVYIRDRCKIIEVPPYDHGERTVIIRDYFPAQVQKQLRLRFALEVTDTVAGQIARQASSLREARQMLVDLVALERMGKKPHTFQKLTVKTWDSSVVPSGKGGEGPRRIGFTLGETRSEEPQGQCGLAAHT